MLTKEEKALKAINGLTHLSELAAKLDCEFPNIELTRRAFERLGYGLNPCADRIDWKIYKHYTESEGDSEES